MLYHTLTDALIHTLAKEELSARSWPHLQLDYSLHHSLGDGVIFTGYLSAEDLHRIIPQLHAEGLLSKACGRTAEGCHQMGRQYQTDAQRALVSLYR
ncbi:hypothetical protein VBY78_003931 [Enterobacter bugandensis]|nr:hypothetical protein [Enterobacter bugandensis]